MSSNISWKSHFNEAKRDLRLLSDLEVIYPKNKPHFKVSDPWVPLRDGLVPSSYEKPVSYVLEKNEELTSLARDKFWQTEHKCPEFMVGTNSLSERHFFAQNRTLKARGWGNERFVVYTVYFDPNAQNKKKNPQKDQQPAPKRMKNIIETSTGDEDDLRRFFSLENDPRSKTPLELLSLPSID